MFEFFRTHSKLTLGFLLLLIIPSFVFFGLENYSRSTGGDNAAVAQVDGRSITLAEWNQIHQRYVERVRRQSPTLDVKTLDTPEARRDTLDGLVRERVLLAAARDLHLTPSDARLQRLFQTDEQFAGIRNPDGTVNRELLAMQGMSSELFAQQLRQDLAMQQVLSGVTATALAPANTARRSLDAFLERREVQLQRFDPAAYRAQVNPSDADIEAFYKANEALFRAPEQATIEYVMLDLAALGAGVAVPEEDLRKYYTENASRYTATEERRASHILIKADSGMSSADRQKAKERAESLLAQVRKAPASFSELARKNSDDPGSAANGGDLDFFGRGAMVKPFDNAVFAMKPGEISNLIESDFGYHIITLTAVRGGEKKPFEDVRPEIEAEVRKSLAQKKYVETAELFTNTVFEQSDSLQPVIDKLKLSKLTATVQRTPPPGATGPLASAKLLDAVFGNDAVRNKRNTDAVEVGPSQLVSARVVQHSPARTLPLAEVKDGVRNGLIQQQSAALARKEGEARKEALAQVPTEALPVSLTLSRTQAQGAPAGVIDAVLRADPAKLPVVTGVDLGAQGYIVLRVTKVVPREIAPEGDARLQAQYTQAWAAAESQAYQDALKKRFKAEIKTAAVAEAASAALR
jgi:peptidyl-prolyl cis-trans isomerase D